MSRPQLYTEDIGAELCAAIAAGKSLRTVCATDPMPSMPTVFKWLRTNPEFFERYAIAREQRAEAIFEESLEIADDSSGDWVDVDGVQKFSQEHVNRARLRVDTRKWFLSKMMPKVYGEKTAVEHSGTVTLESLVTEAAAIKERAPKID